MNIFDQYGYYQGTQLTGGVYVDWTQGQYVVNDPLSLNLYTYCQNNPVMYADPDGNFVIALTVLAAAVLILGVVTITDAMLSDPNVQRAINQAERQIGEKITDFGDKFSSLFGPSSASPDPDPDNDQKRSLKKINNNKEANNVAKRNGYKDAEVLKDDFAKGNGAKFNITRDTKTGELVLQSIRGNVQIPTGLYG